MIFTITEALKDLKKMDVATINKKTGDVKKALERYQKEVDLDPENVEHQLMLKNLQKKEEKAIRKREKIKIRLILLFSFVFYLRR